MNLYDFNEIYKQNYKRSFLFIKSYLHDDMATEDIVAESFVKYWQTISTTDTEPSLAFLLTILKNKALDYLKHQAIHETTLKNISDLHRDELEIRISSLESFEPRGIYSSEIQEIVRATLQSLPAQTRRIFEMSRYENKSAKEIAEANNISVKGVEYHITKALKALRISLKDYLYVYFFLFY